MSIRGPDMRREKGKGKHGQCSKSWIPFDLDS